MRVLPGIDSFAPYRLISLNRQLLALAHVGFAGLVAISDYTAPRQRGD
jgi:hypothetical protein